MIEISNKYTYILLTLNNTVVRYAVLPTCINSDEIGCTYAYNTYIEVIGWVLESSVLEKVLNVTFLLFHIQ